MYKLRNRKESVRGFIVSSEYEIIGFMNRELVVNSQRIAGGADTSTGSLKLLKHFLFIDTDKSAILFNLISLEMFETFHFRAFPFTVSENSFICSYNFSYFNGISNWNVGLYDYKENKLLTEYLSLKNTSVVYNLESEFVITLSRSQVLSSISIEKEKRKWQTDISSYGQIKQILGVTDNTLWVWMSEHKLLGLDMNTGKVIHDFYPLQQLFDQGKSWANFPMFKEADKKLYFFEQDFFAAVNLEDQTTKVIWQEEGYHISLSVIHDDYIYFIGGKAQVFFKNGIGVFDRQKNEVVWQTGIELGDYVVLNQIQVGDNKIYVLDNEGTLRIYGRED